MLFGGRKKKIQKTDHVKALQIAANKIYGSRSMTSLVSIFEQRDSRRSNIM